MTQSFGQSATENYIKVYRAILPLAGDLTAINDKAKVAESVTYMDGLGRPLQSMLRQNSPQGYDVVSFSVYDGMGRKSKEYLPYVASSTDGSSKSTLTTDQAAFYRMQFGLTGEPFAFSNQYFEDSELTRLLKLSAPGSSWQPAVEDRYSLLDHTIKKRSEYNKGNEVYSFSFNTTSGVVVADPGMYYAAHSLIANKTYDENNNLVIEFADKEGRVVCKKVQSSKADEPLAFASTYYIYDESGSLVMVLPPEAVEKLKTALNLN